MDWYRALASRDARFDGVFFVGVTTTGIYCRPVCTARLARRERCVFFRSAAEAEQEGFRACFRCRPELAPGQSNVDARARLVRLASTAIEEGTTDVESLARTLGVTARHLRRVLVRELGVSPVALLQTKRAALARRLVLDTTMPMTEIAFASGFESVRRFNQTMKDKFGRSPTELRKTRKGSRAGLVLRLDYRPPFDWDGLLAFFRARAVPNVERVTDEYVRAIRIGDKTGWIRVRKDPSRHALWCEASTSLASVLPALVRRVRRAFDLDARPDLIDEHLSRDAKIRALVKRSPGVRVPGSFDGFETAVRAVLGQQTSVKGATTLAGNLAARFGTDVETPFEEITRAFPTPAMLARKTIEGPAVRARAVQLVARAILRGDLVLDDADVDHAMDRLRAIPGIGEWTAQYVAMRALAWPDAFLASDLAVKRVLGARAEDLSTAWRPWRAYALMHVWRTYVPERRSLRKAG